VRSKLLSLSDVAEFLQLSEKTIHKMIKSGEIPYARIGNQYRFSSEMLDDWIYSKMEVVPQNDFSRLVEQEFDVVPLSRLISEDTILLNIQERERDQVLDRLAETAFDKNIISDKDYFFKKLKEREEMFSTSIGSGVAVPHLRKPSDSIIREPRIIIASSSEGVAFGAPDGSPVYLLFLIISDSEIVHLKILSKLAGILRKEENVKRLRECGSNADFMKFFIEQDNEIFHKEKIS
jgi:excisionase family DNA binding protein